MSSRSLALALLLFAVGSLADAAPAYARTVLARGTDSGLATSSPAVSIADAPPIGDALELQLFYAGDAGDGETLDYNGMDPILEADLVDDAAHLFFLEKSDALALFVVYKRQAGTQSADGVLAASSGDFVSGDVIVKDAAADSYAIVGGDIVTTHRITLSGRTDGYVATVAGRFELAGDVLTFDFATPANGTSDLPFTSIQVYTGEDQAGDPVWFEIDSGPFSSTTTRRVELSFPGPVPALGSMGLLALLLGVGLAAVILVPAGVRSARG